MVVFNSDWIWPILWGALIVLFVWALGAPSERLNFYNDKKLVCREWNDTWSIPYKNKECYRISPVK